MADLELHGSEVRKFISLYEGHEVLWNTALSSYHRREVRQGAMADIASAMGSGWTDSLVAKKIGSLRSYYNKELTKVRKSEKSGSGGDDVYVPRWSLFKMLDPFLRSHTVPRKSSCNMENVSLNDNAVGGSDSIMESQYSESPDEFHEQLESSEKVEDYPLHRKGTKSARTESVQSEAISVLRAIAAKRQRAETPDDVFGHYVGTELSTIHDPAEKEELKFKIHKLIYDAKLKQISQLGLQ